MKALQLVGTVIRMSVKCEQFVHISNFQLLRQLFRPYLTFFYELLEEYRVRVGAATKLGAVQRLLENETQYRN